MRCLTKILDAEIGSEIVFFFSHLSPEEKGDQDVTSFEGHIEARFKEFLDKKLIVREAVNKGIGERAHKWDFKKETHKLDEENSLSPQYKVEHWYVSFYELILG